MSNLSDPREVTAGGIRAARVAERAGAEHLGASVYELQPGDEMVFHYHVQREELLIGGQRAERRFGALFNVDDAVADYGGLGRAKIVPPARGLRHASPD